MVGKKGRSGRPAPSLSRAAAGDDSMAISSRRAGAPSLRQVIDSYRVEQKDTLDIWAHAVLDRLADSPDAANAFERLSKHHRDVPGETAVHGANVLLWCTMGEFVFRGFRQESENAKKTSARVEQLDKAVAALRKFADEQKYWPPFRHPSPADIAAMRHGLDLIADRIDECRRFAKDTPSRIGATRKIHTKKAAENATISFLAMNVQSITGKPHYKEVADLAQAILGPKAHVSDDRVRAAVRKHRPPFLNRLRRRHP